MATERWSPYGSTATETMWLSHKSQIMDRYLARNESLDEIMKYMRREKNFFASKSAYERHLRSWGCQKNLTEGMWKFINLRLQEREVQGKKSDVYYCGNLLDNTKVNRRAARVYTTFMESRAEFRPTTPDNVAIISPISPRYLQSVKSDRLPWQHFCELIEEQGSGISIQLPGEIRRILAPYLIPEPMPMTDVSEITKRIYEYSSAILPLDHDDEIFDHLKLAFGSTNQRSTWAFLKFTIYLLSNKLLRKDDSYFSRFESGVEFISGEILRWFLTGNNLTFCRAILTFKTPSINAFAETIFCSAVKHEVLLMIRMFLESGMNPNTFVNHEGDTHTPLQVAAIKGNVGMAQILLKHGADTQARDTRITLVSHTRYVTFPQTPLQIAAWMGNIALVKLLISTGAVVNTDETFWSSALQNAAKGGHYEIAQLLLDAKADLDTCFGLYGCPLACAIEANCRPLVDLFLSKDADINSSGRNGITPLQSAAMANDEAMVLCLLRRGASVIHPVPAESPRIGGVGTALQWAVQNNNKNIASLIVDAGDDVNQPIRGDTRRTTGEGYSFSTVQYPLHQRVNLDELYGSKEWRPGTGKTIIELATEETDIDMVKYLLSAGASVNGRGGGRRTALETATEKKHHDMVRVLLEAGADPSKDASISIAVKAFDVRLITQLLQAGAHIDSFSDEIPPALCQAVQAEDLKMVKFLLSLGANPNLGIEQFDGPPIRIAARSRNMEIIKVLIGAGANCNYASNHFDPLNALQYAVLREDFELIEYLIAAGADVNWPASRTRGRTALQQAVEIGNRHIVGLLLELGADINAPAAEICGYTALQAAVSREDICLVDYLLVNGASPNDQGSRKGGLSALQLAAAMGFNALIIKLLSVGARVNDLPVADDGFSALQVAALNGHFATIELLLQFGAAVNTPACCKGGYTALQAAVSRGNIRITKLLLERGSDTNAPASSPGLSPYSKGGSALVIASRNGYIRIAKLLLAKGANLFEEGAVPALCEAASNGRIDMVKLLLTRALRIPDFDQYHLHAALEAANDAGQTTAAEFIESHKVVMGSSYRLSIEER